MSEHLKRYNELKKTKMTRVEIAERAIEIAEIILEGRSYKNTVGCIGRMKALSKAINDEYWSEKMCIGENYEYYYLVHKDNEVKNRLVK